MKKISRRDIQIRVHIKSAQPKVLDKAFDVLQQFNSGELHARKLGCGHFAVLDVTRNERLVIDIDNNIHLMTHEKYNKFIERRR